MTKSRAIKKLSELDDLQRAWWEKAGIVKGNAAAWAAFAEAVENGEIDLPELLFTKAGAKIAFWIWLADDRLAEIVVPNSLTGLAVLNDGPLAGYVFATTDPMVATDWDSPFYFLGFPYRLARKPPAGGVAFEYLE